MRLMLASLVMVTAVSTALAEDPKGDLAKIQGKWTAKVGPEKDIPLVLEIKDKTVNIVITVDGEDRKLKGEIVLDEAKTPKQWTWVKFKGFNDEDAPDNKAIYKIDGEALTVCSGGPDNDRPTEFKAGTEPGANLIVFTKKKEEK